MCVGVYIGPKHTLSESVCTCMYVRRCVCVWASYLICITINIYPMSRDVTQGLPSRKLLAARVTMVAFMTPKNAVEHP